MKSFNHIEKYLERIDAATLGRLATAASDVALVISDDENGVIRDVALGSDEIPARVSELWAGRLWVDTVTPDSRAKIASLLRDAASRSPRWRIVTHRNEELGDFPVTYTAVAMPEQQCIIAIGRSMRSMATLQQQLVSTQQSMERDFLKLRQAEARHRLLFQVAAEAVLVVDMSTRKVVEANPAAAKILHLKGRPIVGGLFPDGFDAPGTQGLINLLNSVGATGRTGSVNARSYEGGHAFLVSASLFREDRTSYFLIRLSSTTGREVQAHDAIPQSRVMEIVAGAPEGFVVTEPGGRVLFANRAFLDLAQLASEEQARNESLERWLGRTGVDFSLLNAQLREHGSIRLFATQLRGEYGSTSDVEICAVSVTEGEQPCLGFTIRDVTQRLTMERQAPRETPRSVAQLTELVGRVPLKDLVRESTDMIEKLCIEAALQITGDNRASAAEILGVSRQSLYAKLRRYGLGEPDPAEPLDVH